MRALAPVIRRIFQQQSRISSSIGSHLHHQPRYYSNPHWDYLNLARARPFTLWPPCRPPAQQQSLSFSNLAGRKKGEEAEEEEGDEVLDMEAGTVRCAANYAPLTPISFIERAAAVYGGRAAVIYGERRRTWAEERDRCVRAAASLATRFGVARGDVVAVLSPNVPAMYELHFAVPMAGAVLCTLNTRHDAGMLSVLLNHSGAKVLFVESSLLHVGRDALKRLNESSTAIDLPVLLSISSSSWSSSSSSSSSSSEEDDDDAADSMADCIVADYEDLINDAPSHFDIRWPANELDPISLNYTSGTTSRPKGVVYNHRGAYLNTIATVLAYDITAMPVYLWTVPMFHCNGWNLPWGVAMQGGTNVCLRHFTARLIFDRIARHGVTHMGGAPTVLNMIVNAPPADRAPLPGPVRVMTGGSPPPPRVLFGMEEMGFLVHHIYGLTETYGPATVCAWMPEWDALPAHERARLKARQGFHHIAMHGVDVKDPVTMESVPRDGNTVGEVMFRGNTVMSGYYKDLNATKESMAGGWLHSGDLAVRHEDGYIQLKDRAKDIIISGGENISSIEVESVIFSHPAVLEAAVVARPDDYWGETPCAFVKLKDGAAATEAEIINFCRERLPRYMAPKTVVFEDLPKTSTGKTQKFVLRDKARAMGSLTKTAASSKLHRGAYLNSVATVLINEMTTSPVYLWTVPMFHCNGWCMVWATAMQGGTSVCIRSVVPKVVFDQIARHGVTNMGGAPTVLNMLANAPASERKKPIPARRVRISTGGAPPPPQVLARMEELGFDVAHGYGLTETYGPATICAWKPEWDAQGSRRGRAFRT
ncbi:hypothetical protein PR202_ga27158 [Eleusine coracana subsp. coracana]|uniref:4-coumarate--CoA ligase n=1 Tax=Eleusine coracana subsp. coracana TaxID=191504 RepID=A0AAV5DG38_ELECO|nr:hypothetical protein PR202_ga27158 [Eleusine coracana subsp. coracana]